MMNLHVLKTVLRPAGLAAWLMSTTVWAPAWAQASAPTASLAPYASASSASASSAGASPVSASSASAPAAAANCPPNARPLSVAEVQAGLEQGTDHGFLWRVTKAGHTSYLYGTIHAAKVAWVFPGPSVREAVGASDTIALELDVLDVDIQKRLNEAARAPTGATLPAPLAQRMRERMQAECLNADALAAFSPEMQMAYMTVMSARREGIDPAYAVEINLAALGRHLKKPVVSLETPESQIKVLQMDTPAQRTAFVSTGLADLEAGRAGPILTRIATVWAKSDWKALSSYKSWCECQRTPEERALMKRLLDDRNVPLAVGIDQIHMSGKRVFAAVGVLHMTGPNGLPALLKKRGYKIEEGDFAR